MTSYSKSLDKILFKYSNSLSHSFLIEGITELQRYYPKLDDKTLRKLVALDPTYKGGENLGKYGKWIINLYYNNIKNKERDLEYRQFISQNTSGINPKTGKQIQAPITLPSIKDEDLYKVTNSLKEYDVLKNKIKKPITAFKTLPDLDEEIAKHKNQGVPTDVNALKRYNVFKKAEKDGLKKIYEDSNWIIGIPTTLESSVPFGEFTSWCTTSAHGYYYRHYTDEGELYILLNKQNGDLFQFHFESQSFMNEHDRDIDMSAFTHNNKKICDFLYSYRMAPQGGDPVNEFKNKFKNLISNKPELEKWFSEPKVKDIDIQNDYITGLFDIADLPTPAVYDEGGRSDDTLSLKWIGDFLYEPWRNYDFYSNTKLNDFSYECEDIWNKLAKENNINISWDNILQEDYNNYDEETAELIDDFFSNRFWENSYSITSFANECYQSGTLQEAEKDIMDELKSNLPIRNCEYESTMRLYLSLEQFYKMLWIEESRKNHSLGKMKFIGYNEKYQPSLELKGPMVIENDEDWWRIWANDESDDDEYVAWDSWAYIYRKSFFDGGRYGDFSFNIQEPRYGWGGFDKNYWEEGCKEAIPEILKIISKNSEKQK